MICQGTIRHISLSLTTRLPEIVLTVDGSLKDLERYCNKTLSIEIKQWRDRRSREANAYYWHLCTEMARVIGQSTHYVHNQLLRECHYIQTFDGKAAYVSLPDTDETQEWIDENETLHLASTSNVHVTTDGETVREYMLLRGSSTFNTTEMSHLIDAAIRRAKDLNIETLTPKEREEMMALYEQHHPD